MDREHRLIMYQSLFNELESIEKNAMLRKEALMPNAAIGIANRAAGVADKVMGAGSKIRGFGSQALEGAKQIREQGIGNALSGVKKTFTEGAIKPGAGIADQWIGGARNVMGTDVGKALAVGAGGAGALGAGALGAGALASRR